MAAPATSIIEGTVKFRDGKKWKSRWCVMRKLSPVADCIHLQLYKDSKERQKNGQTKASLSLQQFLGIESGFTLDKESNTLAILCEDVVPVLAFDTREILMQWRVKVQHNLGSSREASAVLVTAPSPAGLKAGPVRLHAHATTLALVTGRPPALRLVWDVKLLRRYGMVEKRFCVEGGSRCGRGEGLFVFASDRGAELTQLLGASVSGAQSRLSIASRSGSVFEKRLSDTSSCGDDTCCNSIRSSSPSWLPGSQTVQCFQDLDSSIDSNNSEGFLKRPTSLPRCSSCIGKISGLTRSSTMGTTMGMLSPQWIMDNITEKRSDGDRGSLYSRSSGSASDYSVPRTGQDSKRSSPIGCCTPNLPAKLGNTCQCCQQQKHCCCQRKKLFNGPYENYDVPKTPMPLIQEHPVDNHNTEASSLYDTPKKITKCLNNEPCNCTPKSEPTDQKDNHNNDKLKIVEANETTANYVNIQPENCEVPIEFGNYANIDLNLTLEKFESSLQILKSAGFSQEDLDELEDIPESEEISAVCENELSYMHMEAYDTVNREPFDGSRDAYGNFDGVNDNISRITHLSDPIRNSDYNNTLQRRANSTEPYDCFNINTKANFESMKTFDNISHLSDPMQTNDIEITLKRRSNSADFNNENKIKKTDCKVELNKKTEKQFKRPDSVTKSENSFISRFRDSVKIRRSSSVPSKSDKNRDSSSSNDSGVSTGSLKHHRCDFSEFELPITNSKSCRKNTKCTKYRKTLTPTQISMFSKSNSSDPLKNITFQFEEVSKLTKSNSCDAETLTRRNKRKGELDALARNSHITNNSTSSGASDMSDYMESLSVSSLSSCDVSDNSRHVTRPRSGKEYLSIDRALLVGACNIHPRL